MNVIETYRIKHQTEFFHTFLNIPLKYKQECIQEAYNIGDHQNQKTNVKALMSSWSIWEQTNIYNKITNNIMKIINYMWPLADEKYVYTLENAWVAIYKKGHFTVSHQHLPSTISWVYYLKSSGNTPLILDSCNEVISPLDDMLIAFPSYLTHSVPQHEEEEDRICLAGNVYLTKT